MQLIPKGCQCCIEGKKRQVHLTYSCTRHCGFCPIPAEKFGRDVVEYENCEYPARNFERAIEMACGDPQAQGLALSGGEPTLVSERLILAIRIAKRLRGASFHVHAYTNGAFLFNDLIVALEEAGLDELRVNSLNVNVFSRLRAARFDVICEVPCIPREPYIQALIRLGEQCAALQINGITLNEFEVTRENLDFVRRLGNLAITNHRLPESAVFAERIRAAIGSRVPLFFCTSEIAEQIRIARNR